jgi:hypothetical protein
LERVNAALPIERPDPVLLAMVRSYPYRVCRACTAEQSLATDGRCILGAALSREADDRSKRRSMSAISAWSVTTHRPVFQRRGRSGVIVCSFLLRHESRPHACYSANGTLVTAFPLVASHGVRHGSIMSRAASSPQAWLIMSKRPVVHGPAQANGSDFERSLGNCGWGHCFALRKLTNLSPQTAVEEQMAQSKEERNHSGNSLTTWGVPGAFTNPMLAMLTDLSGTLLEGVAVIRSGSSSFKGVFGKTSRSRASF